MTKSKNETKYCIVLKQAKIRYGNVGYGIEKIFVKEKTLNFVSQAIMKMIVF